MKKWLVGVWVVLVIGGWALTESADDSIEPSSGGTEPTSTSPSVSPSVPVDLDCPSESPEGTIVACAYAVED
ncbi:hypothetical protein [Streptomyces sp. NPDC002851]